MKAVRSHTEVATKAELKPSPRTRRRRRSRWIWPALHVASVTTMVAVSAAVFWRGGQEPARAQAAVPLTVAPKAGAVDSVQAIARADALLVEGDAAAAAKLYRQVVDSQQLPPGELTYRLGVCFEMLGQWDEAVRLYGVLVESSDERLGWAAELGQARHRLAVGKYAEARERMMRMAAVSALPVLQDTGLAADALYLLAIAWTQETLTGAPPSRLAPDAVVFPAVVFSADYLLRLANPPGQIDGAPASADDADTVATEGVRLLGQASHPATAILSASLSRQPALAVLQATSSAAGWQLDMDAEARRVLQERTARVQLRDATAASLLTYLLDPLGLEWKFEDGKLAVASQNESSSTLAAEMDARGAERSLRHALAGYPAHFLAPYAYLALGDLASRQGQLDAARASFAEVLQRFPSHVLVQSALFNLAKAELRIGHRDEAKELFYRVVDERTGHSLEAVAYIHLGCLHLDAGEMRPAVIALSRAMNLATTTELSATATLTLAAAYLMSGRAHAANMALMERRADLQGPPYADAAACLAALARYRGVSGGAAPSPHALKEGRDLTATVVRLRPEDFRGDFGYSLLGEIHAELGFVGEMVRIYEAALEHAVSAAVRGEAMFRLGVSYCEQGRTERGQELLAAAADATTSPWAARAELELARRAELQGDLKECRRRCRQALENKEFEPTWGEFLRLMGRTYQMQSDHYNAAVCFAGLTPAINADAVEPTP